MSLCFLCALLDLFIILYLLFELTMILEHIACFLQFCWSWLLNVSYFEHCRFSSKVSYLWLCMWDADFLLRCLICDGVCEISERQLTTQKHHSSVNRILLNLPRKHSDFFFFFLTINSCSKFPFLIHMNNVSIYVISCVHLTSFRCHLTSWRHQKTKQNKLLRQISCKVLCWFYGICCTVDTCWFDDPRTVYFIRWRFKGVNSAFVISSLKF